jgi:hypothetical protein
MLHTPTATAAIHALPTASALADRRREKVQEVKAQPFERGRGDFAFSGFASRPAKS